MCDMDKIEDNKGNILSHVTKKSVCALGGYGTGKI